MIRIADLWKLQEIDTALDARRASLDDARSRLGESEQLIATRAEVAALTDALHKARAAQKDVELQADDLRSKIGPVEQKLYDGSVRNPKELTGLQADVDQLKRQLSTVEDSDLEALAAVEAAEAALATARAEHDAIEAAWMEEQSELSERLRRLTVEIEDYEAQRQKQAGYIDPPLMATYEHVRRVRGGKGVAKLDRNLCTGCRISLPMNMVTKAQGGNSLVQCPNCERILYA
jgi:uncharacterized protein